MVGFEKNQVNEDEFENEAEYMTSNWDKEANSFEDMGLKEELVRGIYQYGFMQPSEIQRKGIPAVLEDRDVIAQAQSGTGKTATYLIGVMNKIILNRLTVQVLVIVPTRELAEQVYKVATAIGEPMGVRSCYVVGGKALMEDKLNLQAYPHIVIGTAGRISSLVASQIIHPEKLRVLVLDEADEMLGTSFIDQMEEIVTRLSSTAQILLFSATLPLSVIKIFHRNVARDEPIRILVKANTLTLEGIKQYYVEMNSDAHKLEVLNQIYSDYLIHCALIFCGSKNSAINLHASLKAAGHSVGLIHGNLTSSDREEQMAMLREGSIRVLVTTNLTARGIDIQKLSLVIIYDLASNIENYLHQIGRSGRYGRKGVAIVFALKNQISTVRLLEKHYDTVIEPMPKVIPELDKPSEIA